MAGLTIMIIRHAEKPRDGLGAGMTIKSHKDDHSLVVKGWQRAGAWAALFGSFPSATYPQPDAVYACNPNKVASEHHNVTQRPYETIIPLCKRLKLTPALTYGVGDEAGLVEELTRLTGTVLVSWEHKKIGEAILPLVAGHQAIPEMPAHWDPERFDAVLRFDRETSNGPWQFRQLFPRLLDGDTDEPM